MRRSTETPRIRPVSEWWDAQPYGYDRAPIVNGENDSGCRMIWAADDEELQRVLTCIHDGG